MSKVWYWAIVFVAVVLVSVFPINVKASLIVSISPVSKIAPQASQTSYTVSYSGGLLGATYDFSVSGLPYGTTYSFSPSSITANSGTSTLTISTSDIMGTYCPGSYAFTVSVTNQGAPADTGSAPASLTVSLVGPPLVVNLSSDQASYTEGQTITLLVTVNRPAEGKLTVTSPKGIPNIFSFQTLYAKTVTRTLAATQPYGTYTATVTADDYCGSYNSASITFSVGPSTYPVSVQLSGVPQLYSATLLINGENEGSLPGSQVKTLNFPIGSTNNITVDQYVLGVAGVRYYCPQNSMTVSSSGSYAFNYQTQYELITSTSPSGITPVGNGTWFNAASSAQTVQAPQMVPGSTAGVQYVFVNWVVDGRAQNGTQVSIPMTGPHNAIAVYKTQYLLTVNSPGGLGSPQGSGYYDAGYTAQFSVTSPQGYLIQQVFVQWQGDYTGTTPQGSVVMNGPTTVNAVWVTSYMNLYIAGATGIAILIIVLVVALRRRHRPKPETKSVPQPAPTIPGAVKCSKCGAENPAGQNHCTECGQSLKG